jgi:hypothetical protein
VNKRGFHKARDGLLPVLHETRWEFAVTVKGGE